eukprot:5509571-Amphidinium_carterae.1
MGKQPIASTGIGLQTAAAVFSARIVSTPPIVSSSLKAQGAPAAFQSAASLLQETQVQQVGASTRKLAVLGRRPTIAAGAPASACGAFTSSASNMLGANQGCKNGSAPTSVLEPRSGTCQLHAGATSQEIRQPDVANMPVLPIGAPSNSPGIAECATAGETCGSALQFLASNRGRTTTGDQKENAAPSSSTSQPLGSAMPQG